MDIQKNIFVELREIAFVTDKFGETQGYCTMFPHQILQNFQYIFVIYSVYLWPDIRHNKPLDFLQTQLFLFI